MLERHLLQDKKKKRKTELEKKRQTVQMLLEKELRTANSAPKQPQVTLAELKPGKFTFTVSKNLQNMFTDLQRFLVEFVDTNNSYVKVKIQEDMIKVSTSKLIMIQPKKVKTDEPARTSNN